MFIKQRPDEQRHFLLDFYAVAALILLSVCNAQEMATPTADYSYYYIGCYTARADLLKESVYAKTPQTCVEICEQQVYNYAVLSAERCYCDNSLHEEERQDEQLCNTRCLANKAQYCGGVGVHSYYSTKLLRETLLNHLQLLNASEHSLSFSWLAQTPSKMFIAGAEMATTQPIITNFLIKSQLLHTYSTLSLFQQPEFIVQSSERRFEMTDLQPATQYNISVDAICGQTVCGSSSILGTTVVGMPSPAPTQPRILKQTNKTISIELPVIKNDNGPVSKLLIIVERVDDALSQPFDAQLLGDWRKAQENGVPYYVTAELDYERKDENQKRTFTVGDEQRYGPYENIALDQQQNEATDTNSQHYHISLGVVSTLNGISKTAYTHSTHAQHGDVGGLLNNFSYADFDSGSDSIIALTVTCIIFACCLIFSIFTYFYLRYKTHQARHGAANRYSNTHELTLQQPIIQRENNGFIVEDELPTTENFKQQMNEMLATLNEQQRLPRNALRMNVNDIIGEGRYGEVITGKLASTAATADTVVGADCQLHVLCLDELSNNDQAHLLRDFRNLTRLQQHEHLLQFYGVSASADWFYCVFEHQPTSLKRRLVDSRRAPYSAANQRLTSLSEELVLQWIYEIASAMEYLSACKVLHKQLCSHNIFVTAESQIKLSVFGPVPFVKQQMKVDLTRWLAPETLRYQHYTNKSDIWSFACVAWECCTLGATPYANINKNEHLLDAIKSGSRPAQPQFVFGDLYQLLLNCWQIEPSERSNFGEITLSVRQLMTSPRHALCFDRATQMAANNVVDMLPYYLPMLEMLNA